jgi:hypothetical protein
MRVPALLSLNPELQRGLWLELTLSRILAAPIVLLLLLGGLSSIGSPEFAARLDRFIIWALLVLWGSRLAAESFGDEVAGRTWDVQRLSAQTPWALTLGKLFGGTVFVWYAAALSLVGLVLLEPSSAGQTIIQDLLGGLTAQSTALFVALALHRFDIQNRRTHTGLAQIAGILASWKSGLLSLPMRAPIGGDGDAITWYGADFAAADFLLAVQLVSVVWLIFGSMRIIRRELGFIDGPLGWALYTIYALAMTAGFVPMGWDAHARPFGFLGFDIPLSALGAESLSWLAAISLTYIGVLGVPVTLIALKKLSAAWGARDWRAVWRNLPVWTPSGIAVATITLFLSLRLAATQVTNSGALLPLAAFGFVMRDIALIYLLRLTYRQRTAVALLVMFVILYGVAPIVLGNLSGGLLSPLFYPGLRSGALSVIAAWVEAGIAWFAVRSLWRAKPSPA